MFLNLPVSAVSAGINNNGNIILLQTPDNIRGRMTSVNPNFFMGGPQLGEVEAGAVAQLLAAPVAVVTGGIGCIVAEIGIARRWPQLRNYNRDEPMKAGAAAD